MQQEKNRKLSEKEQRRLAAFEATCERYLQQGYKKTDLTIGIVKANLVVLLIAIPVVAIGMLLFAWKNSMAAPPGPAKGPPPCRADPGTHRGARTHPRYHLEPVHRTPLQGHRVWLHEGIPHPLLHLPRPLVEETLHPWRPDARTPLRSHPYSLGDPAGITATVLDRNRHAAFGWRRPHDRHETPHLQKTIRFHRGPHLRPPHTSRVGDLREVNSAKKN